MRQAVAWGVLVLCLLPAPGQSPISDGTGSARKANPFRAVDLILETDRPLAAYQIELFDRNHAARIVGIEGNADLPFQNPPYYDPEAMAGDRVILGGFSTDPGDRLPAGRFRVATVMVQTSGGTPEWKLRLTAAATVGGRPMNANLYLDETGGRP
ncbi:MAG: hypothetical protein R3236_07150 [Phycisphaeraceae bacterium]|nr:hypothetical protein [Phycisphaeraceae bacterium]